MLKSSKEALLVLKLLDLGVLDSFCFVLVWFVFFLISILLTYSHVQLEFICVFILFSLKALEKII